MKNIKLGDGLTLTAKVNKTDNTINIVFTDKHTLTDTSVDAYINTCKICKARFLYFEKTAICPSCNEIIGDFLKNDGENAVKCDHGCNDKPKKKVRAKKKVNYYAKAVLADNNIVIDNIVDCYNLTDGYISMPRLETWLKLAIMGLSYREIAKKLSVSIESARSDYRKLARLGLITIGSLRPSITSAVIFHIDNTNVKETVKNDELPESARPAMHTLGAFLNDWIKTEDLAAIANLGKHTVVTYIYELNKLGMIDKKRDGYTVYYKLK